MSTASDGPALQHHRAWLEGMLRTTPGETARDRALETRFGLDGEAPPGATAPPGAELIGYHPSTVNAVLQFLRAAPVDERDTFVDLGAGDGRAVLLARIATGARARGIELQAPLVLRARAAAERLGLDVDFVHGDAREAPIEDGTVFFLFTPFVGGALASVLARLENVARSRRIVVGALGFELQREAPWLVRRRSDAFWLEIYDSR